MLDGLACLFGRDVAGFQARLQQTDLDFEGFITADEKRERFLCCGVGNLPDAAFTIIGPYIDRAIIIHTSEGVRALRFSHVPILPYLDHPASVWPPTHPRLAAAFFSS